jgi:hypothetical protein
MTDYNFAAYLKNKTLFIKRFDFEAEDRTANGNITAGGNRTAKGRPDFNCNYETYTCAGMLEMESLGPLTAVEYGNSVTHNEIWELYEIDKQPNPKDETEIEAALRSVIC